VAGSKEKFVVGSGRGRKPALTVYLPGSRRPPTRGLIIRVPPDIAIDRLVDAARPGRKDRGEDPRCEGLTLDLDALWAAIDSLE